MSRKKREEGAPADDHVGSLAGHYVKETGYAFGKPPLKMPGTTPSPVLDEAQLDALVSRMQAAAAAAPSEDLSAAPPEDELSVLRARVSELEGELAELRDLADLVNDADISALPPELLAVRQRWIADRHAKEVAEMTARGEIL
jgi:hypothetical protein